MPVKQPTITVRADLKKGVIRCTPKGGHVHCKQLDQLQWVSEEPANMAKWFTLEFHKFDSGNEIPWPFNEAVAGWPLGDTRDLTITPTGIIKYIVKVTGCEDLDPIIIVDRR
jgi:hypothetical protein